MKGVNTMIKKRYLVIVLSIVMTLSMSVTASADSNAYWNAAKGTAVVDGQKDDIYSGAQEMKMDIVSDGESDGTTASAWTVYDADAIYFFVEVKDSVLDDTNANTWEKDSVELRINDMTSNNVAFAVDESFSNTDASEGKVLKTESGYNAEYKVPYTTAEGSSVKFSLQVNAASDGKRNCTLHTNDDLKDAWQDNSVFENLVFAADSAETSTTDVPKTGEASLGLLFGVGAIGAFAGMVFSRTKQKSNKLI